MVDGRAWHAGPMPAPSLVVTDLDGTLWHTDDHIAPEVVAAWHEVERRGVPLLVATGRRLASTRAPLARVGLTPPAVVLDGALGVDLATGERFHSGPFGREAATAVLSAFTELGLQPVVHVDLPDTAAVIGAEPSTNPDHVASLLASGARVADLHAVVAASPVLAFSMIGVEHGVCAAARQAVSAWGDPALDRSLEFPGRATLTVAPAGQSKWDGVLAFCSARGLDPTRVVAVGDGANDLDLLRRAALALVPAVAHPKAAALADATIPAAADGGWVEVLTYLDSVM